MTRLSLTFKPSQRSLVENCECLEIYLIIFPHHLFFIFCSHSMWSMICISCCKKKSLTAWQPLRAAKPMASFPLWYSSAQRFLSCSTCHPRHLPQHLRSTLL